MPRSRRPSKHLREPRPLAAGAAWPATHRGVRHLVRDVPGTSDKTYRCPGCERPIAPHTAHVVAWRDEPGGIEERRHWHTGCWRRG